MEREKREKREKNDMIGWLVGKVGKVGYMDGKMDESTREWDLSRTCF